MIGMPLCDNLSGQGHELVVLTRQNLASKKSIQYIKDLEDVRSSEQFDAIINLAGEPIADKPWSEKRKALLVESRLKITTELIDLMSRMEHKPAVFLSGSAIGCYGVGMGEDPVTESSSGTSSFSHSLCADWERAALKAEDLAVRTCLLRTGIVLGDGGALGKMLLPFKMGLGGKIGTGQQWMPWIHISDMIKIVEYLLNTEISGPINCVAPNPVRNLEFSKSLGLALNRPAILPMPAFAMKLLMGEMGEELLLQGKRVVPARLIDLEFEFEFDDVLVALKDVVR